MEQASNIRSRLAQRLFSLRSEKGLSLDQLGASSGISRATLSRIENAEVSPNADTLAAICNSFGLPLSKLMAMVEDSFTAHVPYEDQTEWTDPETGFTRRSVSPASSHLSATADEMHLPPETTYDLIQNSLETHVIVLDGALSLQIADQIHHLTAGDCLRFTHDGAVRCETPPARGARWLQICA